MEDKEIEITNCDFKLGRFAKGDPPCLHRAKLPHQRHRTPFIEKRGLQRAEECSDLPDAAGARGQFASDWRAVSDDQVQFGEQCYRKNESVPHQRSKTESEDEKLYALAEQELKADLISLFKV